MGKDFQALISQKEIELTQLQAQGDVAYKQFIKDAADFLKNWYKTEAENYVTADSDRTIKLGEGKLRELKGKLLDLVDNSEKIAPELLETREICWHFISYSELYSRSIDTTNELYRYSDNDNEINKKLRAACGKLANILDPYGYNMALTFTHDNPSTYQYAYRLGWSEPMMKSMKAYNELYQKAKQISTDLTRLNTEQKADQAKSIWESI